MNSDEIVKSLQPFGVVRIFQSDNKLFRAKLELFVNGMNAQVCSEFGHRTMLSALQELQDNVFRIINVQQDIKTLENYHD